jgi:hypothetical protein
MNSAIDFEKLLEEASLCHDPIGPKRLLSRLSEMPNPFHCDDQSKQNELYKAQQIDFGAIYKYRWSPTILNNADRVEWIDRLA